MTTSKRYTRRTAAAAAAAAGLSASAAEIDDEVATKLQDMAEAYFSDTNLQHDKALREKIKGDEEGYVPLSLVCSLPHINTLLSIPSTVETASVPQGTISSVAEVLQKSPSLTLSPDRMKIKRSQPFAETGDTDHRSLIADPFPWNVKANEVKEFFAEFGSVKSVRLRRYKGIFPGSVFVEFSSEEEMERVVKMKLEFLGAQLDMETKPQFLERMKKAAKEEEAAAMAEADRKTGGGVENDPDQVKKEEGEGEGDGLRAEGEEEEGGGGGGGGGGEEDRRHGYRVGLVLEVRLRRGEDGVVDEEKEEKKIKEDKVEKVEGRGEKEEEEEGEVADPVSKRRRIGDMKKGERGGGGGGEGEGGGGDVNVKHDQVENGEGLCEIDQAMEEEKGDVNVKRVEAEVVIQNCTWNSDLQVAGKGKKPEEKQEKVDVNIKPAEEEEIVGNSVQEGVMEQKCDVNVQHVGEDKEEEEHKEEIKLGVEQREEKEREKEEEEEKKKREEEEKRRADDDNLAGKEIEMVCKNVEEAQDNNLVRKSDRLGDDLRERNKEVMDMEERKGANFSSIDSKEERGKDVEKSAGKDVAMDVESERQEEIPMNSQEPVVVGMPEEASNDPKGSEHLPDAEVKGTWEAEEAKQKDVGVGYGGGDGVAMECQLPEGLQGKASCLEGVVDRTIVQMEGTVKAREEVEMVKGREEVEMVKGRGEVEMGKSDVDGKQEKRGEVEGEKVVEEGKKEGVESGMTHGQGKKEKAEVLDVVRGSPDVEMEGGEGGVHGEKREEEVVGKTGADGEQEKTEVEGKGEEVVEAETKKASEPAVGQAVLMDEQQADECHGEKREEEVVVVVESSVPGMPETTEGEGKGGPIDVEGKKKDGTDGVTQGVTMDDQQAKQGYDQNVVQVKEGVEVHEEEKMVGAYAEKGGGREEKIEEEGCATGGNIEDMDKKEKFGEVKKEVGTGERGANEKDVVVREEDLKEVFEKYGAVKRVDLLPGCDSGYVQFSRKRAAEAAVEASKRVDRGEFKVKDNFFTIRLLQGEEEREYWEKVVGHVKGRKSEGQKTPTKPARGRGRQRGGSRR